MIDWTAIRTAYKVGKLGTISAAADELGIHRASIVRHINSVEEQLGQKIFIRNHRGYQPTEMGYELIEAVGKAESQLSLLISLVNFQGTRNMKKVTAALFISYGLSACTTPSIEYSYLLSETYEYIAADDCASANWNLSALELYVDQAPKLAPAIVYLKAVCLEKENKPIEAAGQYLYLADTYPESEYAYRVRTKVSTDN